MAVKIRLSRKGRKKQPFYHIVVADVRAPRDGKYIEKIGTYNPLTSPATVDLNFEKALEWLQKGAVPTDTCRIILSRKGVLLKKHLLEGVKKGAFDEAEAEKRFAAWMKETESKVSAKKQADEKVASTAAKERLEAEKKVNEDRKAKLAQKQAELAAAAEAAAKEAAGEVAEAEGEAQEATEAPAE